MEKEKAEPYKITNKDFVQECCEANQREFHRYNELRTELEALEVL